MEPHWTRDCGSLGSSPMIFTWRVGTSAIPMRLPTTKRMRWLSMNDASPAVVSKAIISFVAGT